MFPAARMTDTFDDSDAIQIGSGDVFINNLPGSKMTDTTTGHSLALCYWSSVPIVQGSGSVFINNLPAAMLLSPHAVHCCGPACHDSVVNTGSGNVFLG